MGTVKNITRFRRVAKARRNGSSPTITIGGERFAIGLFGTGQAVTARGSGEPVEALMHLMRVSGELLSAIKEAPKIDAAVTAMLSGGGTLGAVRAVLDTEDDTATIGDLVLSVFGELVGVIGPRLIEKTQDAETVSAMYTVLHWLLIGAMPELTRADLESAIAPMELPALLLQALPVWRGGASRAQMP